jgi:DSF synthase
VAMAQPALRDHQSWSTKEPNSQSGRLAEVEDIASRRARSASFAASSRPVDLARLDTDFTELAIRFDADQGSLWCGFEHASRPCFTPQLLNDIARLQTQLKSFYSRPTVEQPLPLRAVIWHSPLQGMWNLGGDLMLFIRLIREGASEELRRYAHACVNTVYQNWTKLDCPFLTIALVQGDALGGGFEAALTNDVIIAEQQSKFGLPEILFNMFPGMGAYSLLCRRMDGVRAEQIIRSGRLYEAEELAEWGLVDLVVPEGKGPAAVHDYLDRNRRRLKVWTALSQVKRRCQPIGYDELIDVTDLWVDTAICLDDADLRRMERLAMAQQRRHARSRLAES